MKKAYYIFGYMKQGNIGNWHFEILDGQPEDGFTPLQNIIFKAWQDACNPKDTFLFNKI